MQEAGSLRAHDPLPPSLSEGGIRWQQQPYHHHNRPVVPPQRPAPLPPTAALPPPPTTDGGVPPLPPRPMSSPSIRSLSGLSPRRSDEQPGPSFSRAATTALPEEEDSPIHLSITKSARKISSFFFLLFGYDSFVIPSLLLTLDPATALPPPLVLPPMFEDKEALVGEGNQMVPLTINWEDLEAHILSGQTAEELAQSSAENFQNRRQHLHRQNSRLQRRKAEVSLKTQQQQQQRTSNGTESGMEVLMEDDDDDDSEAAQTTVDFNYTMRRASRMARSRWEELFYEEDMKYGPGTTTTTVVEQKQQQLHSSSRPISQRLQRSLSGKSSMNSLLTPSNLPPPPPPIDEEDETYNLPPPPQLHSHSLPSQHQPPPSLPPLPNLRARDVRYSSVNETKLRWMHQQQQQSNSMTEDNSGGGQSNGSPSPFFSSPSGMPSAPSPSFSSPHSNNGSSQLSPSMNDARRLVEESLNNSLALRNRPKSATFVTSSSVSHPHAFPSPLCSPRRLSSLPSLNDKKKKEKQSKEDKKKAKEDLREAKRRAKAQKKMEKDKRKKDKSVGKTEEEHVVSPFLKPIGTGHRHTISSHNSSPALLTNPPFTSSISFRNSTGSVKPPKYEKTRYVKKEDLDPRVFLFEEPDSQNNIVMSNVDENVPQINGGTIYKLIQRLTHDQYPDPVFVNTFLLTYRSLITPSQFLELLLLRFDTPAPDGVDEQQFCQTKQLHIRLRVFNVLKQWLDKHFDDFKDDPTLVAQLTAFIQEVMIPEAMVSAAEHLMRLINKQVEACNQPQQDKTLQFSDRAPVPILPMNLKKSTLEVRDIHPQEIARQLTLIEHNLYRAIQPIECLDQRWTQPDKQKLAPNVIALIDRFNKVSKWASTDLVRTQDLKSRAVVLNRFIIIASKCLELNNFNGAMEIIAGLQNSAVYRLKKTWNLLPSKTWELWEEMNVLMGSEDNFRVFRDLLHKVNPPCVPYLGIFLTDLTFITEGNPQYLTGTNLINVHKLRYCARVLDKIKQYQQTPFNLTPVPFIQEYLMNVEVVPDKELYRLSLLCEERVPKNNSRK
ncbi:Son of sevenless 1 [Balamuthia mandrillaris]